MDGRLVLELLNACLAFIALLENLMLGLYHLRLGNEELQGLIENIHMDLSQSFTTLVARCAEGSVSLLGMVGATLSEIELLMPTRRVAWIIPRSVDWWDNVVNGPSYGDDRWINDFRMTKDVFLKLVEALRAGLTRQSTNMRRPITPEKRVAITLWKLATPDSYRSVASQFGVGVSTVGMIVSEVCKAINEILLHKVVGFASMGDIIDGFSRHGFPHCMGAVDGSHIEIRAPKIQPERYVCRKKYYSFVLQAVADSNLVFRDIFAGYNGLAHDSKILHSSPLFYRKFKGIFRPDPVIMLEGLPVHPVLLGDKAYPLMPWLIRPYDEGESPAADRFMLRFNHCRNVVERAFGLLKGRFQMLSKCVDMNLENAVEAVVACCVLHNIIQTNGEALRWNEDAFPDAPDNDNLVPSVGNLPRSYKRLGVAVRESYCAHFERERDMGIQWRPPQFQN